MIKNWEQKYEKKAFLGKGGNGKVLKVVSKENGEFFALKQLHENKKNKEAKQRFLDEINIMKNNYIKINGIMPILDYSDEEFWYVMPIAIPVMEYLKINSLKVEDIIKRVIGLCKTLEKLHNMGITHRDIKPSNIYYYKETFYIGDFGIGDFLEKNQHFTKSNRGLGAIFTIAPEMKRNPKYADGKKADVFSLAKTVWMLLMRDEKGFDGVYDISDKNISLRHQEEYKSIHLVELENLLVKSTNNNPVVRPTIKEFKESLIDWLEICEDNIKLQLSSWNFLKKILLGPKPPESVSWSDKDVIVDVLNIVGSLPAYNHLLFHDHGGIDFLYAEVADENDCIRIYDTLNTCYVIKPKKLIFEGFKDNHGWNYFLLELENLTLIVESNDRYGCEYLVEDLPGNYVAADSQQYGVYDYESGNPLPDGFKLVKRYIRGKFLIVMKMGPYNMISGTYDGRHGDCTAIQFRDYIEQLIKLYCLYYEKVRNLDEFKNISDEELQQRILSLEEFNLNPFKNKTTSLNKSRLKNIDYTKRNNFIKKNIKEWNFSIIINKYTNIRKNIKFKFKINTDIFEKSFFESEEFYILLDGFIGRFDPILQENLFYLGSREEAIKFKNDIEKFICEQLRNNNLCQLAEYESLLKIELLRDGTPNHIFNKQEIKTLMLNADDRVDNQLVIDENGYAKVIEDLEESFLYPVRLQTWGAGNIYVGKYSTLSSLDDSYILALEGWYLYLKSGKKQYKDWIQGDENEEQILDKIKSFYN
ncbi:protein kinase [Macrococcus caseolyticus]|uniref:protein kinase domain-containing protein n=1 Tax=Macrococcoides caseolyticum TaxID=69966 RepID=UPI0024BCFCDD|nr:protein kinase [Macrococcus caseolyticus]MDJ1110094.1 protein kinase [Macrococcus caseolyticus]